MKEIETIRPIIFLVLIALFEIWQRLSPCHHQELKQRKLTNWLVLFSSIISLKIILPMGIAGVLVYFQSKNLYLFSLFKNHFIVDLIITIVIFDFFIYWQHRLMHKFSFLWNMHKVHHSDLEMDYTTALRFHPFEIIFSSLYKICLLIIFSPRAEVFIIYEIILNSFAIFNHSNILLPNSIDIFLRKLIVTPQMHFPHHDQSTKLMNLNFGNFLSIWDKIFKSYTEEKEIKFGLHDCSEKESTQFLNQIKMPLK